jgi:DNA gyrase subunit A
MTELPPEGADAIEPIDLNVEMQRSYIEYAMSVIVARALPDVRDGLKPVHRRIIFAMWDGGYRPDRGFNKCSRVVGDVMGKYHPHGDSAIYDTLVRLVQDWAMRYPLVAGPGQLRQPRQRRGGGAAIHRVPDGAAVGGDGARYRRGHRRLRPELRRQGERADGPAVALPEPARQRLAGIAVGMATQIPPHNLREVADAAQWMLANPDAPREERSPRSWRASAAPDFPTGASDHGAQGHRGRLPHRSRPDLDARGGDGRGDPEPHLPGGHRTAIPGQPGRAGAKDRRAGQGRSPAGDRRHPRRDLRQDRPAPGHRAQARCRRQGRPQQPLQAHPLQTTFGANMLALVDGVPRTLPIDAFIRHWVEHQIDVIQRRTTYRLRKAEERIHLLRGLLKALDRLDEVIALIRASRTVDEARAGLMATAGDRRAQAQEILDMPLRRLAALERQKIIEQHDEIEAEILDFQDILAKPGRQRTIVSDELAEIVKKYRRRPAHGRSSPSTAI